MNLFSRLLAIAALGLPATAHAAPTIDWNGYGSFLWSRLDDLAAVNGDTDLPYGEFGDLSNTSNESRLALQGELQLNDRLSGVVQLVSRAENDHNVDLEWAYLRWQVNADLTLRAGKLRRNASLHTDSYDIGYSYTGVRPPTSVYFSISPIYEGLNAVDLYYQSALGQYDFSAQLYAGSGEGNAEMLGVRTDYEERLAAGLTLALERDGTTLQFSHLRSDLDIQHPDLDAAYQGLIQMGFDDIARHYDFSDIDSRIFALGASKRLDSWELSAELAHSDFRDTLIPSIKGWNLTATKHFERMSLYAGYGEQSSDVSTRAADDIETLLSGITLPPGAPLPPIVQQLYAMINAVREQADRGRINRYIARVGGRYELDQQTAMKLEVEHIQNQASGKTGMLYSVSVDFVF